MAKDFEKRFDIVALGEAMVEFNQATPGEANYRQGFGGDTSNAAIAAARQGAKVGYLSAVGDDVYGRMLRELWTREGVDHTGVRTDAQAFTAVYFVNQVDGFWNIILALLKAAVWPAILVYNILQSFTA